MQMARRALRRTLASVPPFSRWFAEIDALRHQNGALKSELQVSQRNLEVASDELERIKSAHSFALIGSEPVWVPPGHFYSPIPAISDLQANEREVFDFPPAIRGVDLNEAEQVELLKTFSKVSKDQPFTSEKVTGRRYFFENPAYSYTDAIILFCMIRHLRPRRIVEVGSGYSSAAMMDINELFFDNSIDCTFIDPYPQLLRSLTKDSDHQRVRILGYKVQDVDDSIFRQLTASDILFIDSSHVAKTGSDVNYILFKILPLLAAGVYIHFHDVFYPFEYPQPWAFEGRAWNEAYLLRAFLQYNRAFKIRFFTTYLMHKHRSLFESGMPLCLKNTGGSIWLEKTERDSRLDRIDAPGNRRIKPAPRKIEPSRWEHWGFLGEGWYGAEADHCWMDKTATLRLAAPNAVGQKLTIRGRSPHVGGAHLSVTADNIQLGSLQLENAGPVDAEFLLAADLVGRSEITIQLTIDRLFSPPDDVRKLGLSVTTIEII